MNGRSRSALFLMEQLIVIAVFSICAAVCANIFIGSYITARESRDMKHALALAKNTAESFKAFGSLERAAEVLAGSAYSMDGSAGALIYFDEEWRVCGEDGAAYELRAALRGGDDNAALPLLCDLSVSHIAGEEILGFAVAARRGTP